MTGFTQFRRNMEAMSDKSVRIGIVGCGGDITDLTVRRPNLEDVYVKLTGEALNDAEG